MTMTKSEAGKLGYKASASRLAAHHAERRKEAEKKYQGKRCKLCDTVLTFEKRTNTFCSLSCSASYLNRCRRTGRGSRPRNRTRKCRRCGGVAPNDRVHCPPCWKVVGRRIQCLEDAKTDGTRRSLLLRQRGRRCEVCGGTEWQGQPIPIEMDHINGHSSDNCSENLRLICPNCHAQTPTYKNKNKGNGRTKRRERERERAAKA